MLRNYLRFIAPLERTGAKRGYEWRSSRYAGQHISQAWSDLLTRFYIIPILCRVLETSDALGGDSHLWTAADAIEERRRTWDCLLREEDAKRFRCKEV